VEAKLPPARALGRLGAIMIAVALGGCSFLSRSSPAPAVYVPDTAGLVRQHEVVGQDARFVLDDGREFTFPFDVYYPGGTQPRDDAVLLAGSEPAPWMYFADLRRPEPNLTPPGCYVIFGRATMTATHVFQTVADPRGDVVIALPKTVDWTDEGYEEGTDLLVGVGTCVNPQGEAFHFGY